MEILVLGGEGNLGHKMFQLLRARYPDKAFTIRGSLSDPLYARVPLFRDIAVIEKVDAMDLHALGDLPRGRKRGMNSRRILPAARRCSGRRRERGLGSFSPRDKIQAPQCEGTSIICY